jgi:hypothetical protein
MSGLGTISMLTCGIGKIVVGLIFPITVPSLEIVSTIVVVSLFPIWLIPSEKSSHESV